MVEELTGHLSVLMHAADVALFILLGVLLREDEVGVLVLFVGDTFDPGPATDDGGPADYGVHDD